MAEDFMYKRADSVVEALRTLRNRVNWKKHRNYGEAAIGSALYLASIITRRNAIEGPTDRYQISQITIPILEMKNFSNVLQEVCNILKSKNVSISDIPKLLKRKIKREQGKLENILELNETLEKIYGEGIIEKIYYQFSGLIEANYHMNGFYRDVGEEIINSLLEDPKSVKDYNYFTKKYAKADSNNRIKIVARELAHQEKIVRNVLKDVKKKRRIN